MEHHRKTIYRVLILMVGITLVRGQLCKNCLNGCVEETGVCSGGCIAGWDGPTCSRLFGPSLAVDGRTGHHLSITPQTCTHTGLGLQEASWTVTLDAQYNIYRFRIYNRDDGCDYRPCGGRLNGFTLSVGNSSSQNYNVCYQDNTTDLEGPGAVINGVCNVGGPVFGDNVRIMINNSQPLTLCEVQIFVCTNGTYGPECEQRCGNCAEGPSVCNIISGHCRERTPRCMPRYLPPKCDTVCANGTYGPDCEGRCGNCADGQRVCNTTSGHCPERTTRCMPGYLPPKCDTACTNGTYGPDCGRKCGNCADGPSACDVTSGHCPQRTPRCIPGYLPPKCDTVLDSTESPPDYTGVIAGSAGGLTIVVIVGVIIIVVMMRRISRNAQTGDAASSIPNSSPTQETGVHPEVVDRSQTPEPSNVYNTCGTNFREDHSYETIRHYANLDCNK